MYLRAVYAVEVLPYGHKTYFLELQTDASRLETRVEKIQESLAGNPAIL